MFSGITNQVSSLTSMFSKNADEDVPTPPQSATAAAPSEEVTQQTTSEPPADNNNTENQSPTKASGGMFSNVTGKVSGWLPSSLPTVSMPTWKLNQHQITKRMTMIAQVTHKVTAGAKSFGSFFTGVVNKAGAKIKETVKDNSILGEFNKEQEAFIKDQSGKSDEVGICPWIGHQNEDKIKEEILSLSADRRNFVRAPPAGIEYEFSYDASYPTALALMAEDSQLEKMRFDLVPKIITEENFWRNYFYRVSLIIQAGDLGTLGTDDAFGKRDDDDDIKRKKINEENENSLIISKKEGKMRSEA
ncbi:CLUMA_CG012695, isoform D [Clunio marinus]|uniref:CLUMA_CG012695, isoform D n=1 Tax=Clunio marinus TaxID=568069 RepID=A0A1J1IGL3_9DIPT|nr:CLUMA_CG012695, isoform D [Clunio marinus]